MTQPIDKLEPYQHVFDPLYGYIPLTEAEFRVVRSPLFQRLGQIRQLGGFANVLFPSATHTRLSHSLGVLHVTQRMIDSINKGGRSDRPLETREQCLLRLAALMHDIGHMPLSHVGERAYANALERQTLVEKNYVLSGGTGTKPPFEKEDFHEQLSGRIIENDREINKALDIYNDGLMESEWIKPKHIVDLLLNRGKKEKYGHLSPFIKSGLDADRLDFLMRDSYFVGSNYGKIEQDTLIRKLCLVAIDVDDDLYELCLDDDAALVADHFLLSRFYWYSIILANPRVQFVDLLSENVMNYLIEQGNLPSIDDLNRITLNLKDEKTRHELTALQDSRIIMLMRELHENWERNPPTKQREQYVNTAIKVLMGGNLSHKHLHRQGLMEKTDYDISFEKKLLVQAERLAQKEILEHLPHFKGYVKTVCKSTDIHRALPVRDSVRGSEFQPYWHGQVLVRCKKDGFPPCLPLQLSDTNLSFRLGSSRPQEQLDFSEKDKKALVHVNFAVFIVWPGEFLPQEKATLNSVLSDHFHRFTKPLEDAVHGYARPITQTNAARV